jgi:cell division control protein 6
LKDILYERAKEAFDDDILEEGVIPFCAAITAQNGGDARRALDLLRMSADIAERNGDQKITEAHVRFAKNKTEMDAVAEVVKTLNSQSKMVLMSIIKNTEDGQTVMITGDVYATYKRLCETVGISVITQRRVADVISELDMLGVIHARVKSFGRNGRTKEIELSAPKEIVTMLQSDELFKELDNYKSPKQTRLM